MRDCMLSLLPNLAMAYQLFGAARTPLQRVEPCSRAAAVRCVASIDAPVDAPMEPFVPAARLSGSDKPTVWGEFGQLAAETGAVNLGQGFPDWQPPAFVVEEVQTALREGYHQYTRPAGHPQLVEVLAQRYSTHLKRMVDPMTEVATTVGASQALYLSLHALIDPGDEVSDCPAISASLPAQLSGSRLPRVWQVVLLEPAFDLYYGQVRLAGGTVVPVALQPDETGLRYTLDPDRLDAAVRHRRAAAVPRHSIPSRRTTTPPHPRHRTATPPRHIATSPHCHRTTLAWWRAAADHAANQGARAQLATQPHRQNFQRR